MAIDAAVLRARVEVAGVQQAQQQLRSMDQSFKGVSQSATRASGGIQTFDQRTKAIQGSARQAGTATTSLGTAMGGVGRSATQSATGLGRFSTGMKGIAAAAGGFAVAQVGMQAAGAAMGLVVDQASAAVDAASNLNESITKVDEVFDSSAVVIKAWAEGAADAIGQSEQQALEAAGTFGALFDAMGLGADVSTQMSMDLTELASDLASFNNSSPEEMLIKLRAGLVGELEPLRSVGVALNAATVEAKALELGLADTTAEITEADKVQARYKLILEQTATAQGDFARTSDGLANQQRILTANLADTRAEIGQALLPVVNDLTMALNNVVSSDQFQGFLVETTEGVGELAVAYRDLGTVIEAAHGPMSDWNAALEAATPINMNYAESAKNIAQAFSPAVTAWELGTSVLGFVADQVTDTEEKTEALTQAQIINTRATLEQDLALSNLHVAQGSSAIRLQENIDLFREVDRATMDTAESLDVYTESQQAMTQEGHRGVQMATELGVAVDDLDRTFEDLDTTPLVTGLQNFGEMQDLFQQNIENAAAGVSEWEGHLQGAEKALGFLQDRIDAGIPLTEEQQAQYDTLTEASERYTGGIEDESEALIDAEVAKAQFIKVQDELNAALEAGEITQDEYNDAIGTAAAELDPATAASMGLLEAQEALATGIDGTITKLVNLLVELGILDETEAEAIVGADITEAEGNVDHMEGRLQTYEGIVSTATADVDDSGAVARIAGVEGELTAYAGATWTTTVDADTLAAQGAIAALKAQIAAGAILPVSISVGSAGGGVAAGGGPYAKGTPPGGTSKDQIAWVGEEGPELVFLPQGAHVLPNDESMKFASLMGEIPGFADGTGDGPQQGVIDIGKDSFTTAGMSIGEAISAGIQLGLDLGILENAAPSGEEIAAAMIDGAIKVIEAEGPDAVDSFVVNLERIPELAGQIGHDTVIGLLDEYAGLQGELQLAIISGADTAEIQARLDAIEALIVAWGGDAVGEVESIGEAMEAALNMERFAGLFELPSSAAPFDVAEIFGGDALDQVREEFQSIWDLQKIAQDLGYDEFAEELGKRLAELGLQEEMLAGIMGSDMGQQIADQLKAELKAAHIEDMWADIFTGSSFGLEEILSGDALKDVQTEFQELFDLQRIAQEMGFDDLAAELGRQMADLGLQEQMINDMLGTDFGQHFAEAMEAEEAARIAAEAFAEAWNTGLDAAFSDNPVNFAESVQDQISDIEGKIDLAPVLGIPADIVAGWQEELGGLQGEQDAFWASLAEGIASGLIDPAVLEELNEAGQAQLDAYLTPIVGEEGAQKIIDGIGAVTQITAEGLGQLESLFEENGELAAGHIDDLVQAAIDGSITWADAMSLMANVPRDELIPTLEDLENKFRNDLVQAILATDEAAEQIAEQGLAMVADALANINSELGDLMGFSDDFARLGSGGVGVITSIGGFDDGAPGSSSGGGGSSGGGSGGSFPSDFGGGGGVFTGGLADEGIQALLDAERGLEPDYRTVKHAPVPPGTTALDELVTTIFGKHSRELLKIGDDYLALEDDKIGFFFNDDWTAITRRRNLDPVKTLALYEGVNTFFINPAGPNDAFMGNREHALDFLSYGGGLLPPVRVPDRFADGGVTLGPSLAILGDNPSGKEMVLPFERNQEFARQIAIELSTVMGGRGGAPIIIESLVVGDEQIQGPFATRVAGKIFQGFNSHLNQSGIPMNINRR